MRRAPVALLLTTAAGLAGCSESAAPTALPAPSPATTAPSPLATARADDPLSPRPAVESAAPTGKQPVCAASSLTVMDADLLADDARLQEVFAVRTTGPNCALNGWPEVALLGPDGKPFAVASRRVGRAGTVTLGRDSSLSFVLGTPRSQDCRDVSALLVRLPGTNQAIRANTTMQVCDGQLEVGPVERRQDDEGAEH